MKAEDDIDEGPETFMLELTGLQFLDPSAGQRDLSGALAEPFGTATILDNDAERSTVEGASLPVEDVIDSSSTNELDGLLSSVSTDEEASAEAELASAEEPTVAPSVTDPDIDTNPVDLS